MSTEQFQAETPPQQPAQGWGAPQQPKPPQRWSAKKTVAAVAIAIGVAGAGGAVVYAARGSSDSSAQGGQMGGPGGQMGGQGGAGSLMSALHGEYVVSDGNGGYTTELMQTGKVTAISATSLTAASDDGFTKTYTIGSDTAVGNNAGISSIATGDTVTVVATTSGNTATAESVSEQTADAQNGQGGQQGQPGVMPRRDESGN
jgi:hypothetical protein